MMNLLRSRWLVAALALGTLLSPVSRVLAAAPSGRYVTTQRTVEDRRTKLVWQRAPLPDHMNWATADLACKAILSDGGKWRLPTMNELQTIVDVGASAPAIDTTAFPSTPTDAAYWTSTPYVGAPGAYWTLTFAIGRTSQTQQTEPLLVRCVSEAQFIP